MIVSAQVDGLRAWRALPVLVVLALLVLGCGVSHAPGLSDLELSATETAGAPTAPPAPPAPTMLKGKRLCRGDFRGGNLIWVEDVDLTWLDNAGHETGYKVFRNRIPQDVLPAESTRYHLQFRYNQGLVDPPIDTFAVEALRDESASPLLTIQVPRCP